MVTKFAVLLAGAAVPGGVHPPVWLVVECVVNWTVKCVEEGNVEVSVGFAAFAVGCAEVVVAERRKEGKTFSSFSIPQSKVIFSLLNVLMSKKCQKYNNYMPTGSKTNLSGWHFSRH